MRLQRQASFRNESSKKLLPTSSLSPPHTGERPNTPYKNSSNCTERIQQCKHTFHLTDDDLQHFYRIFCYMAKKKKEKADTSTSTPTKANHITLTPQNDITISPQNDINTSPSPYPWEEKGAVRKTLSISDFFATFSLAHASSNGGFLDAIFDLVGTNDLHAMSFAEFLDGVLTFGMFKLDSFVNFVFFILDKEKEGRILRFQLLRFVESIHAKKILLFEQVILPTNSTPSHQNYLPRLPAAERQKASIDCPALRKFCVEYPTLLEPMFLLQCTCRRRIMGEKWWKRKEYEIKKHCRTAIDQSRQGEDCKKEEKRLLNKKWKGRIIIRKPSFLRRQQGSAVSNDPEIMA